MDWYTDTGNVGFYDPNLRRYVRTDRSTAARSTWASEWSSAATRSGCTTEGSASATERRSALTGKAVQLEFTLDGARLYAFQFARP